MTDINIDIDHNCEDEAREIFADHQGEVIEYIADGPGGGNPNFTIRVKDIAAARQLVREIYSDHGLTDAEIDELYIKKA